MVNIIHCSGNGVILTKFSPLTASEVARMKTSGATSDENFAKIKTAPFHRLPYATVSRHVRFEGQNIVFCKFVPNIDGPGSLLVV